MGGLTLATANNGRTTEGEELPPAEPTAVAPPPMTKSWAEALGVVVPKEEPAPPPPPAWGGATAVPSFLELGLDEVEPMPFEFAVQEALKALDVAAPGKEMKKRCGAMMWVFSVGFWCGVLANGWVFACFM